MISLWHRFQAWRERRRVIVGIDAICWFLRCPNAMPVLDEYHEADLPLFREGGQWCAYRKALRKWTKTHPPLQALPPMRPIVRPRSPQRPARWGIYKIFEE